MVEFTDDEIAQWEDGTLGRDEEYAKQVAWSVTARYGLACNKPCGTLVYVDVPDTVPKSYTFLA